MRLSIIGTGYVGLVTGTCFAEMGHDVTCIDIDQSKIEKMKQGVCPIFEPGLESLMQSNHTEGRLNFSHNYDSVSKAQAIFLAVGTPASDDGQADLKYIFAACDSIASHIVDGSVIVVKSTVPVGTGNRVREHIKAKTNKRFYVVNNPEFLKEGSAVEDFMKPERIIIGHLEKEAGDLVEDLYEPFNRQVKRTIRMSNISAEMTKYAANCFLATKISFMNEVAKLCDIVGADVEEVRHGISTDSRIGSQFLYPGPGYGGSCFPKDVKALAYTARENGVRFKIIEAVEEVNREQKKYLFSKVKKHFKDDLKGKVFVLWGTAFKANTDDIRDTPAIDTAVALTEAGATVRFHDPEAALHFEKLMNQMRVPVERFENKYDALNGADGLLVMTEWKQYRAPDFDEIKSRLKTPLIFDGRNLYNTKKVLEQGITYYAIGKAIR
ncbi:MAG TPA: UDP-glucose/GDP-mannose dehydrogenase family protein [Bacteriovoracaceae bacterium]|nr:UDP-glucose/GDP-mannose dehydrogenase family protein [Bacteriovoracaceae bacterium]